MWQRTRAETQEDENLGVCRLDFHSKGSWWFVLTLAEAVAAMAHQPSLHQQVTTLKKSMVRRERKRNDARQDGGGGGEGGKRRNLTGGVQLGSAAAAVAAAAALGGPQVLRCDLCSANFPSEAAMQQHVEGPAHRKALQRRQEDQRRRERLGHYADAAEAAMAAAAWSRAHDNRAHDERSWPTPDARTVPSHSSERQEQQHHHQEPRQQQSLVAGQGLQQPRPGQRVPRPPEPATQQQKQEQQQPALQQQQQRQDRGRGGREGQPARPSDLTSHQELLRQARGEPPPEPLSIDGWVPPAVDGGGPAAAAAAPPSPDVPGPGVLGQAAGQAAVPAAAQLQQQQCHVQEEGEEDEEHGSGLHGLLGYGSAESDDEPSSDGSEQGPMDAGAALGAAEVQQQPPQQQADRAVRVAQPDSGSDDGSSSSSDSDGDCEPHQVSYFTFT